MTPDWLLLRRYAKDNSQEAFASLTARYLNLVYSICLREVHNPELAQDAAQAVFLLLARVAPEFRSKTALPGWLFRTSRFAAQNARTREERRKHYEGKAAQEMQQQNEGVGDAAWEEMEPLLNQSLAALREGERECILLRFFQDMSFIEVGAALGLTEEAARKRVMRALEKMRRFFTREGIVVPSVALAALLSSHAVKAAPAICSASIVQMTTGVLTGHANLSLTSSHIYQLSVGVLKAMKIVRIKTISLCVAAALGVGLTLWLRGLDANPTVAIPAPPLPAKNAYDYFKAAGKSIIDGKKIGYALGKWDASRKPNGLNRPYSPAEQTALVRENSGAIQTFHQGFPYPYQAPPERSYFEFSHNANMRGLARLLALQGQVNAEKGDWNGTMAADLDAIQLGEEMPHGGAMLPMLEAYACETLGRRQAWNVVARLDAAGARSAAHRLERIRADHVAFADTLQEEKWSGQAELLEIMRQTNWADTLGKIVCAIDAPVWQKKSMALRLRLTGKRTIMSNYTRSLNQAIANARKPFALHPSPPSPPTDPYSQWALKNGFEEYQFLEVKANTQNALLLVMLALRAYQLDHGAYPATLSSLAPGYLKVIPDDPFALSGPLRYKVQDAKYLLYSIGPDSKDNGGQPIFSHKRSVSSPNSSFDPRYQAEADSKGDIVAAVNVN